MNQNVVIATGTFYKETSKTDIIRQNIALKMIKSATDFGYEIVVVDAGSSEYFLEKIKIFGAKVYAQKEIGMGAGRREAFKYALKTGKEIIVYAEPEKEDLIRHIPEIIKPIEQNLTKFAVPKRKSLEHYPLIQQYCELAGNHFWKHLTQTDLDMWFGVRIFHSSIAKYFINYDGKYGDKWDSIFIPVVDAIKNGVSPLEIEIDYIHPKEQTEFEGQEIEFDNKRIEQLFFLTKCLEKHWKSYSI